MYEKFLRNVAGLGRVDRHGRRTRRYDTEHRRVDVLVVGGGRSGRAAARAAATSGERVLLVDENVRGFGDEPFEVLAPARAIGIYEGGLVPVDAGSVLLPRAREADRGRDRRGRAAARVSRATTSSA